MAVPPVPSSTFVVDDPGIGVGSTDVPVNYIICDRSGFRVSVKEGLRTEWNNVQVREESFELRNAADFVRTIAESQEGSVRPEPATDTFITTAIDPAVDL